uniref:Uncharacterized protein n=1 Tax=viral metagenome TaxID=1070528 RepID=A0A6C0BHP8_9ZZZZ
MAETQLTILAEQILGSNPTQALFLRAAVSLAQELVVFNGLSVKQKEVIIVHVLEKCVQKSALPADQKAILVQLLDSVIPETLKIILEVSNGEFSLKDIPTTPAGCFAFCTRAIAVLKSDPQLLAIAEKKLTSLVTEVTDVKVDISGASVQLADAVSAKLDTVVSVVTDISGTSVASVASVASIQQVVDVVSAKIETVVSVPASIPAPPPVPPPVEEVIQVVSSNVPDVSGNLALTPEEANVKGLFLDWAKKEPSL